MSAPSATPPRVPPRASASSGAAAPATAPPAAPVRPTPAPTPVPAGPRDHYDERLDALQDLMSNVLEAVLSAVNSAKEEIRFELAGVRLNIQTLQATVNDLRDGHEPVFMPPPGLKMVSYHEELPVDLLTLVSQVASGLGEEQNSIKWYEMLLDGLKRNREARAMWDEEALEIGAAFDTVVRIVDGWRVGGHYARETNPASEARMDVARAIGRYPEFTELGRSDVWVNQAVRLGLEE